MLIGLTGSAFSGRKTVLSILESLGYEKLEYNEEVFENIVPRWRDKFVVIIPHEPGSITKRPWFLHIHITAHFQIRSVRSNSTIDCDSEIADTSIELANSTSAHINLINNYTTTDELRTKLLNYELENTERVRPSWDRYFMTIAELAANRSNCMKRRVGCVLVKDDKIVATGYNGTSRKAMNCNEGGCPRCNSGSKGGSLLSTCLCLHAEENALLEAGRSRAVDGVLYCNTCPCLTCSIKIVQTGISEVVYSQEYSMDTETYAVFERSGVKLRRYT